MEKLSFWQKLELKARVRKPISRPATIILGILPFIIIFSIYFYASYKRHLENPRDRMLPNLTQMIEGVKEVTVSEPFSKMWLVNDTLSSLRRLLLGMLIGSFLAIIIGLYMGCFRWCEAFGYPLSTVFAKIPPPAILPILFILLGVDEATKIALIAFGVFPTLTLDIMFKTKTVHDDMIIKGYTLGASTSEVQYRIILKQIMPEVINSIRLILSSAWVYLIVAEAISADSGLGYRIFVVQRQLGMHIIIPYVAWICLIGYLMDLLLRLYTKWRYPWFNK